MMTICCAELTACDRWWIQRWILVKRLFRLEIPRCLFSSSPASLWTLTKAGGKAQRPRPSICIRLFSVASGRLSFHHVNVYQAFRVCASKYSENAVCCSLSQPSARALAPIGSVLSLSSVLPQNAYYNNTYPVPPRSVSHDLQFQRRTGPERHVQVQRFHLVNFIASQELYKHLPEPLESCSHHVLAGLLGRLDIYSVERAEGEIWRRPISRFCLLRAIPQT
ncbi:hypothetical protein DM02DRAFT_58536 [Periconia macrospinosa]|uniref:Uncharacterized protein n=1 Tax=Periconia macrospinosa TaxID=97972 RepID=A0A2V1CYJ0_9PLEO|nr:hypothetical protein DM02DRAFT_58536 [Periconia macrospinosa]